MPVYVLKATMPHREYMAWLSYFQYEDADVQEIQLAVLSTLVSSGLGNKKAKVDDFILRKSKPKIKPNGITEKDVRGAFGMFTKKAK